MALIVIFNRQSIDNLIFCGIIYSLSTMKENFKMSNRNEYTEMHDEFYNDLHKVVKIDNLTFEAATVLRNCDFVAYRESVNQYIESQIDYVKLTISELDIYTQFDEIEILTAGVRRMMNATI